MSPEIGFDRCLSFINCQLQPGGVKRAGYRNGDRPRAITISRQSGSGGHVVAHKLLEMLNSAGTGACACPWTVFDRNLVERVLEDHHLPSRLARFMPEDKTSEISDTLDELFGLHPPSWTLVHKTAETILHLAELGNVILIGRGATVITSKLDYVFHVRLVGSVEKRVKYLQELHAISPKAALELLHKEDNGRRRFLRTYFKKDTEDPLLYHLVINTDLVPYDEAARLIANAIVPQTIQA